MDNSLLTAALVGYQFQLQKLQNTIAEIRSQLGLRSTVSPAPAVKGRRQMSASARKRIAAAQKKRWAAFHAKSGNPAPKEVAPERKMSPERRAALAANLEKARAARAAKRAAA